MSVGGLHWNSKRTSSQTDPADVTPYDLHRLSQPSRTVMATAMTHDDDAISMITTDSQPTGPSNGMKRY